MLSLLAIMALLPGQSEAISREQSPADVAFNMLVDLKSDWTGKITFDGREVIVKQLQVFPKIVCNICNIRAITLVFKFEGDFRLPELSDSELPPIGGRQIPDFLRAIRAESLQVNSALHGDQLVMVGSGSELVLGEWKAQPKNGNAHEYDFVVEYYRRNVHGTQVELAGSLIIKDRHLTGTLSGASMPRVTFAFSPMSEEKLQRKE